MGSSARFAATWLILCAEACRHDRTQSPEPVPARRTHDAAAATATALPAMPQAPPVPDASADDVNLLRTTRAEVAVSSVVQNHTDRPENLVDGDLATAWSTRTDQLEGSEIDFRVPADAIVHEIRMTVGMTRAADAGDLFTLNPRIAEVQVLRDGALVGTFPLDVTRRDLQTLRLDRQGGLFRVVFSRVTPGANRAWREATVSEFEVRGRAGTPIANTPTVRVGRLVPDALSTTPYTLAPDAHPGWGCFAWSSSRQSAACVTGHYGNNTPETSDTLERVVYTVHFANDATAADIPLLDPADAGDVNDPTHDAAPAPPVLRAVQHALAAGGFVSLEDFAQPMFSGVVQEWTDGAAIRWVRRRTSRGGDNMAPRYTDHFEVRWARGAAFETIGTDMENEPTGSSEFTSYFVPGGRHLVLEQQWHYGDEGEGGQTTTVFVCDRVARVCR